MTTVVKNCTGFRAGYSLVEVTLALLVVAIGLTATFALFPEGLRATRAAVDDTEISMFAEYVFTTLDLTAGFYGGNFGPGWDMRNTDDFISLMLSESADPSNFELREGTGVKVFHWIPDFYGMHSSQSDLYYKNFENMKPPFATSAFTYTLDIGLKGGAKGTTYALLKVWPGEWNTIADDDKFPPRIFYREILPIR